MKYTITDLRERISNYQTLLYASGTELTPHQRENYQEMINYYQGEVQRILDRRARRKARKTINKAGPTVTPPQVSFLLEFAQNILDKENLTKVKIISKGSKRVSYFRSITNEVNFTPKSINNIYYGQFIEYQQCKWIISGLNTKGSAGLQLLAIHEIAHAVCYNQIPDYRTLRTAEHGAHGKTFQTVMKNLVDKYFKA